MTSPSLVLESHSARKTEDSPGFISAPRSSLEVEHRLDRSQSCHHGNSSLQTPNGTKVPKQKHLPSENDMDPGVNTYAEGSGLPKNKDKNTKLTAGDSVYVRNPTKPPTR